MQGSIGCIAPLRVVEIVRDEIESCLRVVLRSNRGTRVTELRSHCGVTHDILRDGVGAGEWLDGQLAISSDREKRVTLLLGEPKALSDQPVIDLTLPGMRKFVGYRSLEKVHETVICEESLCAVFVNIGFDLKPRKHNYAAYRLGAVGLAEDRHKPILQTNLVLKHLFEPRFPRDRACGSRRKDDREIDIAPRPKLCSIAINKASKQVDAICADGLSHFARPRSK
jgi:hypothetical protein